MNAYIQDLRVTAKAMITEGKGILAMDESNGTCNKRLAKGGEEANLSTAQKLLYDRAKCDGAAHMGKYS